MREAVTKQNQSLFPIWLAKNCMNLRHATTSDVEGTQQMNKACRQVPTGFNSFSTGNPARLLLFLLNFKALFKWLFSEDSFDLFLLVHACDFALAVHAAKLDIDAFD